MSISGNSYLEHLKLKYALSSIEFEEGLNDIITHFTKNKTPSGKPKVIILGAQPGAGKTELQKEAEYKLLMNSVICNADNFREYHPFSPEIATLHTAEYPEVTAEYAHKWNDELCRHCRKRKLNYILETTFSSGERLNATIREIKKDGYQVDIMLLAVNSRLSLLGTHMRYEDTLKKSGVGRKVSREAHDSRFTAIPNTIQHVKDAGLYDNVYIYTRSVVLTQSTLVEGVSLVAHNPNNPLDIYREELNRPWSKKLSQYFETSCDKVLASMKSRDASLEELETFRKNVGLNPIQKQVLERRRGRRL